MVKKPISKKAAPARAAAPAASSNSKSSTSAEAPRLMATVSNAPSPASRTVEPVRTAAPAAGMPAGPAPAPGSQPSLRIIGQYLKDLSFENPNAPQSLTPQSNQPDINISVNVNANNIGPNDFEVELQLEAKATGDGKTLFATEVLYAGIFKLENFPQNVLHAAVLIECPRLLFPFARQILADATRNGGFPPLMLDPIDFAAMYQQRMRQQSQQQASA
jgi:preprotein translocase subunit SecB